MGFWVLGLKTPFWGGLTLKLDAAWIQILVNFNWGLNPECLSTIHNIAENVPFYHMNLTWGQKVSCRTQEF